MKVTILQTIGNGEFREGVYEVPEMGKDEIRVKNIMTGVCRSDIDMMVGNFGPLPLHMQGHEGLGMVVDVGTNVQGVQRSDIVATRGEPAYADYYNCRNKEFVVVPEAHPRYILEPVACGINVIQQSLKAIEARHGEDARMLILGSGFLAYCAYTYISLMGLDIDIDVVGNSNKELWGNRLKSQHSGQYNVVVDLSSSTDVFDKDMLHNEALVIFGVEKTVTTNFSNLLWKACTMIFPSPRSDGFYTAMEKARDLIQGGHINVDRFWTKCYNRNTEWRDAFRDGLNRPANYSRGYIVWD